MLPIVAIVGRPNVGKSSLLNYLAGRRISIVDPTEGVTRDRVSTPVEFAGHVFELTDTGGYGVIDRDNLTADIERQIALAIGEAQLILFVVDVKTGKVPLDQVVADYLRGKNKKVLLVANKADGEKLALQTADFYSLGFGDPVPISCTTRQGKDRLLEKIVDRLDFSGVEDLEAPEMKLAVVGKRNAGKSTLINTLAGAPRVIVSEVPGTTRDSIDVRFERDGHGFLVIDTAGVRKKAKITRDDLEFYAFHRAQRSIRRADVVFMLIDATVEMGDVDQKLGAYIAEEFKPCIIVINKWDLVEGKTTAEKYEEYIGKIFPLLDYAPIAFISAKENQNIDELIRLAQVMHEQASTRLSTSQLNTAVEEILALRGPSSPTAQKVKVYYATQIDVKPPTLVLFVNNPDLITEEYRRFFVRQLRERLPFSEVPIRLFVRGHHRSFEKADGAAKAPQKPTGRARAAPSRRSRRGHPGRPTAETGPASRGGKPGAKKRKPRE
jgi:GTP-binding protein